MILSFHINIKSHFKYFFLKFKINKSDSIFLNKLKYSELYYFKLNEFMLILNYFQKINNDIIF